MSDHIPGTWMQEIRGHVFFKFWIYAYAGRIEKLDLDRKNGLGSAELSNCVTTSILSQCTKTRTTLLLNNACMGLHLSAPTVLIYLLIWNLSANVLNYLLIYLLNLNNLSVCQPLRCIQIPRCQQSWRGYGFILLLGQEVNLAQFHLCCQKTWGSWSRDKRIYYSVCSRQHEVDIHTGFPCSSSPVGQCRAVQGRLLPRLWVCICPE